MLILHSSEKFNEKETKFSESRDALQWENWLIPVLAFASLLGSAFLGFVRKNPIKKNNNNHEEGSSQLSLGMHPICQERQKVCLHTVSSGDRILSTSGI